MFADPLDSEFNFVILGTEFGKLRQGFITGQNVIQKLLLQLKADVIAMIQAIIAQ